MEEKEKYEEMREVIKGQLNVADELRMSNYNIAGMILTELDMKYGVVSKCIFDRARGLHGHGYIYERREGTEVDLTELRNNQQVCAGGKGWHVLMTEIPQKISD